MTELSFFEQAISFVLHIDQHLFALVAEYGALLYLFLFIVVFCETGLVVTPFLPATRCCLRRGPWPEPGISVTRCVCLSCWGRRFWGMP